MMRWSLRLFWAVFVASMQCLTSSAQTTDQQNAPFTPQQKPVSPSPNPSAGTPNNKGIITNEQSAGTNSTTIVEPPAGPVESDTHSWLVPSFEPPATTFCTGKPAMVTMLESASHQLTVALGHSGIRMPLYASVSNIRSDAVSDEGKLTVLQIGNCKALVITSGREGLLIDADVSDPDGNIVASITSNEIHLVPAQFGYAERPDRSTLIVRGKSKEELFWLRFLSPDSVKVRGYFACEGQATVHVGEEAITTKAGTRGNNLCFDIAPGEVGFQF